MNRRSTIKYLSIAGLAAGVGSGYRWSSREREHPHLAVDRTLERLSRYDIDRIRTTGAWQAARTFDHLAQSIEFSMEGYPLMKSELFRNTAGTLAFSVFRARGRMSHGLDEAIPGEVVAAAPVDPSAAFERLKHALERFEAHAGPLHPHFAYGTLDKAQYTAAHAMHVDNHLEEFETA